MLVAVKICAPERATTAVLGEIFMDELVGVGVGVGGALECPPPQAARPNTRKSAQIPFSMLIPLGFCQANSLIHAAAKFGAKKFYRSESLRCSLWLGGMGHVLW
jgi:hypothetical protein